MHLIKADNKRNSWMTKGPVHRHSQAIYTDYYYYYYYYYYKQQN